MELNITKNKSKNAFKELKFPVNSANVINKTSYIANTLRTLEKAKRVVLPIREFLISRRIFE